MWTIIFLAYITPTFVIWNVVVRLLFKDLYQVSTLQAKLFFYEILFNKNLPKINFFYYKDQAIYL